MSINSFNNKSHCLLLEGAYFQDLILGSTPIFKYLCLLKIEVDVCNLIQETVLAKKRRMDKPRSEVHYVMLESIISVC